MLSYLRHLYLTRLAPLSLSLSLPCPCPSRSTSLQFAFVVDAAIQIAFEKITAGRFSAMTLSEQVAMRGLRSAAVECLENASRANLATGGDGLDLTKLMAKPSNMKSRSVALPRWKVDQDDGPLPSALLHQLASQLNSDVTHATRNSSVGVRSRSGTATTPTPGESKEGGTEGAAADSKKSQRHPSMARPQSIARPRRSDTVEPAASAASVASALPPSLSVALPGLPPTIDVDSPPAGASGGVSGGASGYTPPVAAAQRRSRRVGSVGRRAVPHVVRQSMEAQQSVETKGGETPGTGGAPVSTPTVVRHFGVMMYPFVAGEGSKEQVSAGEGETVEIIKKETDGEFCWYHEVILCMFVGKW